jgi:hypothetical protein
LPVIPRTYIPGVLEKSLYGRVSTPEIYIRHVINIRYDWDIAPRSAFQELLTSVQTTIQGSWGRRDICRLLFIRHLYYNAVFFKPVGFLKINILYP